MRIASGSIDMTGIEVRVLRVYSAMGGLGRDRVLRGGRSRGSGKRCRLLYSFRLCGVRMVTNRQTRTIVLLLFIMA